MAATYYPESMELREGRATDIDHSGPYMAAYVDHLEETKKAALEYNMAKGRLYDSKIDHTSDALRNRRMNHLERVALRKAFKRGGLAVSQMHRLDQLTRSADLNDSAIYQITIVQFVQQIIGQINTLNVVNRAFTRIPADNLRGKIPEGGTPEITIQSKRFQEPTVSHADFGQTEFRIRRNDLHLLFSREDRYEASIDPLAWSSIQGNKLLMQARDLLAIKALSNAPEITTTTFPGGTSSIGSSGMHVVPRATADSIGLFQEIMVDQFTKWRNVFKYVIMHPLDYRVHETNFFSRNKMTNQPASGMGIKPFLGLEDWGTTAIISPWIPRNRAYFVTNEGAYELDGPKVVDSDYDPRKFADYFPVRDFVGYHIVHPERFTGKVELNIEGVTTEAEITTNRQIQDKVKLPEDQVQKNDDA